MENEFKELGRQVTELSIYAFNRLQIAHYFHRLINKPRFIQLAEKLKLDLSAFEECVRVGDVEEAKKLLRGGCEITIRDLRKQAKFLGVKNWSRMDKQGLLYAIDKYSNT